MKILTILAITLFLAAIGEAVKPDAEARQSYPRATEKTEDITAEDVATMVQCSAYLMMLGHWSKMERGEEQSAFLDLAASWLNTALFFSTAVAEDHVSLLNSSAISAKIKAENLYGKDGHKGLIKAMGDECSELQPVTFKVSAFLNENRHG